MSDAHETVDYEAFGAVGDGVTDDLPAICRAHDHANANGLPVRSRGDATYHLGRQALTAVIATDTDWNTSRFVIDDRDVDDHTRSLFVVRSLLPAVDLPIDRLACDQAQLDHRPDTDLYVLVEDDAQRRYIRRGLNQNDGVAQHDCFILRRDGRIDSPIDWQYDRVTRVDARPIDDHRLVLSGGVFTTTANCMRQEVGYNYWRRNIAIQRSNTEVVGLVHYVVGETEYGHPYSGFLSVEQCADVTLRDCFVTPHRIYQTIGSAGKPVSMGSYDLHANNAVNLRLIGCRMNHLVDRTRWGIIGSNFCKNVLLEDCQLSRMDTHMGISGGYTIRGCTLGWMGLNAIGRGELLIEDTTFYGGSMITFRPDYGSTWQGDVIIRNSRWTPNAGAPTWPHILSTVNDSTHDFGYPCSMPWSVTIDGLEIDDSSHTADYTGAYLFTDPDRGFTSDTPAADRAHPYQPCRRVTVRGLRLATGLPLHICANPAVQPDVDIQT